MAPRFVNCVLILLVLCSLSSPCASRSSPEEPAEVKVAIAASYRSMADGRTVSAATLNKLIDAALSANFESKIDDPKSREELRRSLAMWMVLISGWASFESLEGLVAHLHDSGQKICVDGWGATLGDVLLYFQSKGHFESKSFVHKVANIENLDDHSNLLADTIILMMLDESSRFRAAMTKRKVKLIIPFGYEGINVFNVGRLEIIIDRWAPSMPLMNSEEDELEWMCKTLQKLMTNSLILVAELEYEFVFPKHFKFLHDEEERKRFLAMTSAELVEHYLAPNFRSVVPPESHWRAMFAAYEDSPKVQLEIANTLQQNGLFYSMTSLSANSMAIYKKLVDHLAQVKLQHSSVLYLIPFQSKSFGLATMLYFLNNNILNTKQIFSLRPDNVDREQLAMYPIVILDDFAGSGASLERVMNLLLTNDKEIGPLQVSDSPYSGDLYCSPNIFVAPLLQTTQAKDLFARFAVLAEKNFETKVVAVPGMQLTVTHSPPKKTWMGLSGFERGTTFISFPYMAPDNNCAFMSYVVAPLLTLGGLGVKRHSPEPPPLYEKYAALVRKRLALHSVRNSLNTACPDSHPVTVTLSAKSVSSLSFSQLIDGPLRSVYNWVLTENNYLLFGKLPDDNPLQIGVSHFALAQGRKLYGAGRVFTQNQYMWSFSLDADFPAASIPDLKLAMLLHIAELDDFTFVADAKPVPLPSTISKGDFTRACRAGYTLRLDDSVDGCESAFCVEI